MFGADSALALVITNETAAYTQQVLQRAARRVREWRRTHGEMSQIEFAALARVSVGCVQGFENGTRKTRDANLLKIATAIGVTLQELIREDDPPVRPDPLLEDLKREDLLIAHYYHHSGAEAKLAVKRFYSTLISAERRERIAAVMVRLLSADEDEFARIEVLLFGPPGLSHSVVPPYTSTHTTTKKRQ
jgi:transcriptional regulator with XRE-family HTH domain